MASDHRGNHVHAGKRTDDEIMANPFYVAGDPLLQKATMDRMQGDYPSMEKQAPVGKVPPMIDREGVKRAASNIALGAIPGALLAGDAGYGYSAGTAGQSHSLGLHNPVGAAIGAAVGGAAMYGVGKYMERRDNR